MLPVHGDRITGPQNERTAGFSVVRDYTNEKGQAMCLALRE